VVGSPRERHGEHLALRGAKQKRKKKVFSKGEPWRERKKEKEKARLT